MFERKAFLLDVNNCLGCRACEMACRAENQTPTNIHWRHVTRIGEGRYLSMSCNHCANPECFRVCPTRAFSKRKDGIVEINTNLCTGCRKCVYACPYHAPQYNPFTNKVTRCQMCYPRQDMGLLPACVEACPTGALQIIDLLDFDGEDIQMTTKGFPGIRLTEPSVRFRASKEPQRFFRAETLQPSAPFSKNRAQS